MARKNNNSTLTLTLTLAERIAQIESVKAAEMARLDRIRDESLARDQRVTELLCK